jgi:hypothetical protein
MSDHTSASGSAFAFNQSYRAFDNMPKRLWDEEVVRIIKASKRSQRRLAEWAPELTNVHPPVAASTKMDSLQRLRKEDQASKMKCEISKQLHALYDPMASDKLPARFEELLQRLDNTRH